MLASLLPGLRHIRTPLAAGYVFLLAGWVALAPILPPRSVATGILADLHTLVSAVGKGPALAGVTFGAYVLGILSVALTDGLTTLGHRLSIAFGTKYKTVVPRLLQLSAGGTSRRVRRSAIQMILVRQLSSRYLQDEEFRAAIQLRLEKLYTEASEAGISLPEPFGGTSIEDLAADMLEQPFMRVRVLLKLIDIRKHAEDLLWESRFVDAAAATAPEILEECDRMRAEGEFRVGMTLPISALLAILAYRANPWFILGIFVPVWLYYAGNLAFARADWVILQAITRGKLNWDAADNVTSGRLYYWPTDQIPPAWPEWALMGHWHPLQRRRPTWRQGP